MTNLHTSHYNISKCVYPKPSLALKFHIHHYTYITHMKIYNEKAEQSLKTFHSKTLLRFFRLQS